MISLLGAISPTAAALLGEPEYKFAVTWRYYGGTNIARCHGATASSTNSPEIAASAAATKHWNRFLGTSGVDGSKYQLILKPNGMGVFIATFKLQP